MGTFGQKGPLGPSSHHLATFQAKAGRAHGPGRAYPGRQNPGREGIGPWYRRRPPLHSPTRARRPDISVRQQRGQNGLSTRCTEGLTARAVPPHAAPATRPWALHPWLPAPRPPLWGSLPIQLLKATFRAGRILGGGGNQSPRGHFCCLGQPVPPPSFTSHPRPPEGEATGGLTLAVGEEPPRLGGGPSTGVRAP